jgi:hypothetical protein
MHKVAHGEDTMQTPLRSQFSQRLYRSMLMSVVMQRPLLQHFRSNSTFCSSSILLRSLLLLGDLVEPNEPKHDDETRTRNHNSGPQ